LLTIGDAVFTYAIHKQNKERGQAADWIGGYLLYYLPVVFVTLTIALGPASIYAVENMNRHFVDGLKTEIFRIKTTLRIFALAYLTRALVLFATHIIYGPEKEDN